MATKPLRVGIVMDPIESITPYKDSSLAMLLEAERREAEIHRANAMSAVASVSTPGVFPTLYGMMQSKRSLLGKMFHSSPDP